MKTKVFSGLALALLLAVGALLLRLDVAQTRLTAAEDRAAQYRATAEVNASVARELAEENDRLAAAESRRQKSLTEITREAGDLRQALQEARKDAPEDYRQCLDVRAPGHVVRLQRPGTDHTH